MPRLFNSGNRTYIISARKNLGCVMLRCMPQERRQDPINLAIKRFYYANSTSRRCRGSQSDLTVSVHPDKRLQLYRDPNSAIRYYKGGNLGPEDAKGAFNMAIFVHCIQRSRISNRRSVLSNNIICRLLHRKVNYYSPLDEKSVLLILYVIKY